MSSGYLRRTIKADGTAGYMIIGQEDGKEEFLICSHVKCNARYEIKVMDNGKIVRYREIQYDPAPDLKGR
ncbi:hypothetical protein [Cytobacillus kochii]|uniref:hypothetical protein n=1 Tax=Cytobacillus kochii TaxID=859143 RepID=UPI00402AD7D0